MSRSGGQEESLTFKELRANLARLSPESRHVLLMISVQGLSYEEISEQLGVAVGTLKCRVFRARKQLREWMLDDDEPVKLSRTAARGSTRRSLQGRPSTGDGLEDGLRV